MQVADKQEYATVFLLTKISHSHAHTHTHSHVLKRIYRNYAKKRENVDNRGIVEFEAANLAGGKAQPSFCAILKTGSSLAIIKIIMHRVF